MHQLSVPQMIHTMFNAALQDIEIRKTNHSLKHIYKQSGGQLFSVNQYSIILETESSFNYLILSIFYEPGEGEKSHEIYSVKIYA
jgi:hypothetical protein